MTPNDLDEYIGVIVGWAVAISFFAWLFGVFE